MDEAEILDVLKHADDIVDSWFGMGPLVPVEDFGFKEGRRLP